MANAQELLKSIREERERVVGQLSDVNDRYAVEHGTASAEQFLQLFSKVTDDAKLVLFSSTLPKLLAELSAAISRGGQEAPFDAPPVGCRPNRKGGLFCSSRGTGGVSVNFSSVLTLAAFLSRMDDVDGYVGGVTVRNATIGEEDAEVYHHVPKDDGSGEDKSYESHLLLAPRKAGRKAIAAQRVIAEVARLAPKLREMLQ